MGDVTVNKNELIEAVAKEIGSTKADAARAIDATFGAISKALKKGNEVRLVNFGTFLVANRKATTGRNPRTGESVPVPPRKVVVFKPGLEMKQKIK